MNQTCVFRINLTKIDGSGDFSCPRCGTAISPDDNTDEAYSIMETKVNIHGLREATIRCNKCESHIHLTGFCFLQKLEPKGERLRKEKKEEPLCYIAHI